MKHSGTIHMGFAREYFAKCLSLYDDWRRYLVDFTGTREQAIAAIMDGPEIVCSCDCEKDERGACTGNPTQKD